MKLWVRTQRISDEFIQWCRIVGAEPFICLNMGTGTLEDALAWVEYCNRYVCGNLLLPLADVKYLLLVHLTLILRTFDGTTGTKSLITSK